MPLCSLGAHTMLPKPLGPKIKMGGSRASPSNTVIQPFQPKTLPITCCNNHLYTGHAYLAIYR